MRSLVTNVTCSGFSRRVVATIRPNFNPYYA